jgi:hypothetical protein
VVGNKGAKLSAEDRDIIFGYLKNFIQSNKIKNSTDQEKEEDIAISDLKNFLVYLEDKNLVNSKLQDAEKYKMIVNQMLNKDNKIGHYFDNRRRSNPANYASNASKVYGEQAEMNVNRDLENASSKKMQSRRLIFHQSRSERNSNEREGNVNTKISNERKKSAGLTNKSFKDSEKNSTLNKTNKKMNQIYNGGDKSGNAFAHNREIFTNASQSIPK